MFELVPLAMGVIIGLGVQRVRNLRVRAILLVVLCLVFGALASYLAGELEISYAFISFDALLVWLGALGAVLLGTFWRRRAATR